MHKLRPQHDSLSTLRTFRCSQLCPRCGQPLSILRCQLRERYFELLCTVDKLNAVEIIEFDCWVGHFDKIAILGFN